MPSVAHDRNLLIVKVGGSLYDLPDLGPRLNRWLAAHGDRSILIVPGGGSTADAIRLLDRVHRIGEEGAHWLALRALSINAHFLQGLLPGTAIVSADFPASLRPEAGKRVILDAHAFTCHDEKSPGALPHTWSATSDALAARVALVAGAGELILLKSTDVSANLDWQSAADAGLVDPLFPHLLQSAPHLPVSAVDFR